MASILQLLCGRAQKTTFYVIVNPLSELSLVDNLALPIRSLS